MALLAVRWYHVNLSLSFGSLCYPGMALLAVRWYHVNLCLRIRSRAAWLL